MQSDPQLRAKLETLMLVYPDVTVARALHFLDEAAAMLEAGGLDYSGEPRVSRASFTRLAEGELARLANEDTEEIRP